MIRPRVGDFVYSSEEISVMQADIEHFAGLGIKSLKGFVCGVLRPDATIDEERTKELVRDVVETRGLECEGTLWISLICLLLK